MKKVNHKYLKYLLLGLLALPTLSGIDLLSFGDGYSVPFTFILFYLGVIEAHEDNHFSFIPFIIVGLMDVLCESIMPLCSDIVHGDMSTCPTLYDINIFL